MDDKEIILKLLEAIEGTLEYQNKKYGNKYYRIFPFDPRYSFLKETPKGVLSNIFDKLEQDRVIEVTFYPTKKEDAYKLACEDTEKHGLEGLINEELYYDLSSYHFIKLENFKIYLRNYKEKSSGKSKKYLIKKGELRFDKESGIIFFKNKQIKIPLGTNQYYVTKFVFSKPIGKKIKENDIYDNLDPSKEHERTIYDACRALNKKIKKDLGLENLFINKAALVFLNDKYFS